MIALVDALGLARIQIAAAVVGVEQREDSSRRRCSPRAPAVAPGMRRQPVQASDLARAELRRQLALGNLPRVGADQHLRRRDPPLVRDVQFPKRHRPEPFRFHRIVRLPELAGERDQRRRLVAFEQPRRGDVTELIAGNQAELDLRDGFSERDSHYISGRRPARQAPQQTRIVAPPAPISGPRRLTCCRNCTRRPSSPATPGAGWAPRRRGATPTVSADQVSPNRPAGSIPARVRCFRPLRPGITLHFAPDQHAVRFGRAAASQS